MSYKQPSSTLANMNDKQFAALAPGTAKLRRRSAYIKYGLINQPPPPEPCPTLKDYKGVCFRQKKGDYQAYYYCKIEKKQFAIGYYPTPRKAADARAKWIVERFPDI